MKKYIIFLVFIITGTYSFSAFFISDNSYVIKLGTPAFGTFNETITGTGGESDIETSITPFSSYSVTLELHTKLEVFQNAFFGVGFSYQQASAIKDKRTETSELAAIDTIGIDYIPIFIMLQYKFDSTYYPDEDMFLNFKLGLAIERINSEWQNAAEDLGIQNIANSPSPFVSIGWGFEYNSFIFEIDYQYNASAAVNLSDSAYKWVSYTNRINLNIGYRFNIGSPYGSDSDLYDDYDSYDDYDF